MGWFEAVGVEATASERIRQALADLVELEDGDAAASGGIMLVERIDDATRERIRDRASREGVRFVCVATSAQVLAGGCAWRLLEDGAADVIAWDATADPARAIAARIARWDEIDRVVQSPVVAGNLVGCSAPWRTLLRQVVEVAAFSDASVLVIGESGTGKELIARLVHTLDPRPDKRELGVLDCAALVPELAGSEFFGHERGAYTGSLASREGAFALADGGTLFLDEVGELPLGLQAQLLRVVQERSYKRLGANAWQRSSFRLVCATNKVLVDEVERGRFRRDLFHRIASWVVRVPPLAARRDDILLLARHVIREMRPGAPLELDETVRDFLLVRDYPGNVRELRHLVMQMCQRHVGSGPITVGDLPPEEVRALVGATDARDRALEEAVRNALALGAGLRDITRDAGEVAIRVAVADEDGNLQRAARRLGVTDRALQLRRARPR